MYLAGRASLRGAEPEVGGPAVLPRPNNPQEVGFVPGSVPELASFTLALTAGVAIHPILAPCSVARIWLPPAWALGADDWGWETRISIGTRRVLRVRHSHDSTRPGPRGLVNLGLFACIRRRASVASSSSWDRRCIFQTPSLLQVARCMMRGMKSSAPWRLAHCLAGAAVPLLLVFFVAPARVQGGCGGYVMLRPRRRSQNIPLALQTLSAAAHDGEGPPTLPSAPCAGTNCTRNSRRPSAPPASAPAGTREWGCLVKLALDATQRARTTLTLKEADKPIQRVQPIYHPPR
jgi:hypothetical protein